MRKQCMCVWAASCSSILRLMRPRCSRARARRLPVFGGGAGRDDLEDEVLRRQLRLEPAHTSRVQVNSERQGQGQANANTNVNCPPPRAPSTRPESSARIAFAHVLCFTRVES